MERAGRQTAGTWQLRCPEELPGVSEVLGVYGGATSRDSAPAKLRPIWDPQGSGPCHPHFEDEEAESQKESPKVSSLCHGRQRTVT